MRVALPESLVVEPLVSALEFDGIAFGRMPHQEALEQLKTGGTDVALLPTLTVLQHLEEVDVMPGVALSSWDYPFARVLLRDGLSTPVKSLAVEPVDAQEAFLAHLMLSEHYGQITQLVPLDHTSIEVLDTYDAVLVTGNKVPLLTDAPGLDLGQEWYELVNYPMVWGLFAVRKGEAEPLWRRLLLDAVQRVEDQQALWLRAREMPVILHAFFSEDLRFRFDDLAVASLTELRDYLFQRGAIEEVADLPIADLPDDDRDEDTREPLL